MASSSLGRGPNKPFKYWATETDTRGLVGHCQDRVYDFKEVLKRTNLVNRVKRSWAYYHNLYYQQADVWNDKELVSLGEQGEKVGAAFNHYRSLMQSILTIVTGEQPAFDCLAVNSDIESLHQAQVGEDILEYYMSTGLEAKLRRAAEHAAVMTAGYVVVEWNDQIGEEVDGDPDTGEIFFEGDVDVWNANIFDVVYDYNQHDWSRQQWCLARKFVNKWDLIDQFPSKKERILAVESDGDSEWQWNGSRLASDTSDAVPVWKFWHISTVAMPGGVEFMFIEDEPLGKPRDFNYKRLPIHRIMPAETLLTSFGYTPGFDLQGPQEALNAEMSSILTNHRAFGINRIWVDSQSNIDHRMLTDDLALVQSDTPPQVLQLAHTAGELYKMSEVLEKEMMFLSGINQTFRGSPEASLKSGTALALIDAKATQYQMLFMSSWKTFIEQVGTSVIETLQLRPNRAYDRVYSIAGRAKKHQLKSFTPESISKIQRVIVRSSSALMKTLSGRLEMATVMLQNNLIKTPEQMLTVIESGQIDALTESETAQISLIRSENTSLMEGGRAQASILDDHVLHVREHSAVANSPEIRQNQPVMSSLHAHVMEHMQMLNDPGSQAWQVVLGYQAPLNSSPQAAPKGAAPSPTKKDTPVPGMAIPQTDPGAGGQGPRMPQLPEGAIG